MTHPLLAVANLYIHRGRTAAVRDVSFEVSPGSVFGLIGPDGAGKSTLLSSLATLVEPSAGSIHVCGISVQERPAEALSHLGFMPDQGELQEDLRVREFLELFASAHAIPRAERGARIDEILEQMGLTDVSKAPVGKLNLPMRKRVVLAKTLLHDPRVLLLDEPAAGLEAEGRDELTRTLRTLGQAGKAIVVSSSVLDEMETFCTHVGILDAGSLALSGRTADVLEGLRPGRSIRLSLVHPDGRLQRFLAEQPNVKDVEADHESAQFHLDGGLQEAAGLLRRLVESDFELAHFAAQEGGLGDILAQVHGDEPG